MTSFQPTKTRELENHHMRSQNWNDFKFRDDDVIVATYGKAGTTWTQWIVHQLLHGGELRTPAGQSMHEASPWLDIRIVPLEAMTAALEAQTHRRVIKTHLPLDALVFSPKAKYLYVMRSGLDVAVSMHNHHSAANDMWYDALNNTPNRVGPPIDRPNPDRAAYVRAFLDNDGAPFWSFYENVRTWWQARDLPNVRLVHFADLKKDLAGEMRKIAAFLEIEIDEAKFPAQLEHCTFDWMKTNAELVTPLGGAVFEGGAKAFINKGENKKWVDLLTPEEVARYEQRCVAELGAECAAFLNRF